MTQVVPFGAPIFEEDIHHRHRRSIVAWSFFYLFCSVLCSMYYHFHLLDPSVRNDYWWAHFNSSATQTFLCDLFNAKLVTEQTGSFNLAGSTLEKDYSSFSTFVDMRPTAARQYLLRPIPIPTAISVLRKNTFNENIRTIAHYCWLDFQRRWELGHTPQRQLRCDAIEKSNAAAYFESILRNALWHDLQNSQYLPSFQETILNEVLDRGGELWWNQLQQFEFTPLDEEANTWKEVYQLTHFTTQLQNVRQEAISETIKIVNALGVEQIIKITTIPSQTRGLGAWTTGWAYAGIWNDMLTCVQLSCCVVRDAKNHPNVLGLDWDLDLYDGPYDPPSSHLVRTNLGAFVTIDIRAIFPPQDAIKFVQLFQQALFTQALRVDEYFAIPSTTVNPVPFHWQSPYFVFYGGNFLCPFGSPMPYVQDSFGFYDDCGSQDPLTIRMERQSVLFAMAAMDKTQNKSLFTPPYTKSICQLVGIKSNSCMDLMNKALRSFTKFNFPRINETTSLESLETQIIQLATDTHTNEDHLLTEPIISNNSFSFFGWITIYEWIDGRREVFRFEGDESNFTIMSRAHEYSHFIVNTLDLPHSACEYIRYISIYISCVLLAVAICVVLFATTIQFNIDGVNLFQFNRVVGSVWIGRPLLFLRGMTAILVFSTSSLQFTKHRTLARMINDPHHILDIAIVSGEATWITYVINDFFLPWTSNYSKKYSRIASSTAFISTFFVEILSPFQAIATVERKCTITSFASGIVCESGQIQIGSITRGLCLVLLQFCCVFVAYIGTVSVHYISQRYQLNDSRNELIQHILVPAAADQFLNQHQGDAFNMDKAACVMSGVLPLGGFIFDLKLWTVFRDSTFTSVGVLLRRTSMRPSRNRLNSIAGRHAYAYLRFWSVAGLAYIILSVGGSYTFLLLTESTMANDFWWVHFNENNTQAYLCNWFNQQLQLTNNSPKIALNQPKYSQFASRRNISDPNIRVAPTYANVIQDEVNTLPNVIQSLRQMNGCDVPWIFTPYCYVDFNRTWQMAATQARQDRCKTYETQNGAVYLEAILRNSDYTSLSHCYGEALEFGIFTYLRQFNQGARFLKQTLRALNGSVSDEVAYWQNFGITFYSTQWQNFKLLGVTEKFSIQNGFGISYPLTLKKFNMTMQFSKQTSFKMYWGLANDLMAISSNSSVFGCAKGLIREDPMFLFQNITPPAMLMEFGIVKTPVPRGFDMLQQTLGPFGSVDMKRIGTPGNLINLYAKITESILFKLAASTEAKLAFMNINTQISMSPTPTIWDDALFWEGNILCPCQTSPQHATLMAFDIQGSCGIDLNERITMSPMTSIFSVLASGHAYNRTTTTIEASCARDLHNYDPCMKSMQFSIAFLQQFFDPKESALWYAQAQKIRLDIRDAIQLILLQYISFPPLNDNIILSMINIFDDPDFDLMAWTYLYDWTQGTREVVMFQGDAGTITTISTSLSVASFPADPMEIPLNVALYLHRVVQYFTFVMICVATITMINIFMSRGYIEGINMFSFNRVGGLVWLGRPFMLVRSLTAMCLLSTGSLELTKPYPGLLIQMVSSPPSTITTIFSSGEVAWLVYILNDMFSTVTQQYTTAYSVKSSLLLWFLTATWSYSQPVEHSVDVLRRCTIASVDGEINCEAGIVAIGSVKRFLGLILLAFGSCLFCYAFERIRHPDWKPRHKPASLFLYAAANYQFRKDKWEYHGVYHLDRASAALNGILSISVYDIQYLFDVKTWRLYTYPIDRASMKELPQHLKYALSLPE